MLMYNRPTSVSTQPGGRPMTVHLDNISFIQHDFCMGHATKGVPRCISLTVVWYLVLYAASKCHL